MWQNPKKILKLEQIRRAKKRFQLMNLFWLNKKCRYEHLIMTFIYFNIDLKTLRNLKSCKKRENVLFLLKID